MNSWLQSLQMHEILIYGLVFGLPIVVIGFSFVEKTIQAIILHLERLKMLEEGIDLVYYPEQPKVENRQASKSRDTDETQPATRR